MSPSSFTPHTSSDQLGGCPCLGCWLMMVEKQHILQGACRPLFQNSREMRVNASFGSFPIGRISVPWAAILGHSWHSAGRLTWDVRKLEIIKGGILGISYLCNYCKCTMVKTCQNVVYVSIKGNHHLSIPMMFLEIPMKGRWPDDSTP